MDTTTHNALPHAVENQPNAAILIKSLRHMGYDNFAAIADIVDNAIDADSRNVIVTVSRDQGDFVIEVLDDGVGMDFLTADEALKLGSDTARDPLADLGRYGMGLVTASLSIGRRLDVLSRCEGIGTIRTISDVDEVVARNAFVKYLDKATNQEEKTFDATFKERGLPVTHGTIVRISKSDGVKYTQTAPFISALKKNLAQTFRKFIAAGKSIVVNGDKLVAIDPLGIPGTEVFSDDTYDFKFVDQDGTERTEQIRLVIGLLPDFGLDGNKERQIDLKHQGFYVLRNNREIAEAETLGLFTRHNEFNRFRAELYVPGSMDVPLGVNFTKRNVKPNQALTDKLKEITKGQLATIRARTRRLSVKKEDDVENHNEATRIIGQKSHLLVKPKAKVEVRDVTLESVEEPLGKSNGRHKTKRNAHKKRVVETLQNAKFESVSLGEGGQIYEVEQEGKTVIVRWNIDHPFYQRFVANQPDKGMVTAVDFFIFSMALAELMVWNDETAEIIDKMKSLVSMNTRTLLK